MTTSIGSTDRTLTTSDIGTTVEKTDSILFKRVIKRLE